MSKANHFDWKQYKPQGVKAVDMTAAIIVAHRVKSIPVKAVHLVPDMYKQFMGWVEKNLGRELEPGETFQFDTVNIEMGTRSQSTPFVVELWADHKPELFKPKMGIA